ncbi:MAG TPA: hypothetical protein RMI62_06325, partial [Polyangiaceae bacterium LLY-WYZ-15_(1-7)]|nr:hypothetical protein [Polyangiaceae bacterium LLY-WYZ-15_(1-7)]
MPKPQHRAPSPSPSAALLRAHDRARAKLDPSLRCVPHPAGWSPGSARRRLSAVSVGAKLKGAAIGAYLGGGPAMRRAWGG